MFAFVPLLLEIKPNLPITQEKRFPDHYVDRKPLLTFLEYDSC